MALTATLGSTVTAGRKARLNIGGKTLCFAKATPMSTREIVSNADKNMCADIDPSIKRAQKGRQIVGWKLQLDLTWPIMEVVLPLLGVTDLGSNVYEMGATDEVVSFAMQLDMGGTLHDIDDCVSGKYALRGSKGGAPISLEWDVVGSEEDKGSTFTVDKVAFGDEFVFSRTLYTLENDAQADELRTADRFMIQVDNKLIVEHNNSEFITDATIGDRQGVFATSLPTNAANDDLYFSYRDDDDGKNSTVTLVNDLKTCLFEMPAGLAVAKPGSMTGKGDQIRTPVTMLLHRDDNAGTRIAPLKITVTNT